MTFLQLLSLFGQSSLVLGSLLGLIGEFLSLSQPITLSDIIRRHCK